MHHKPLGERHRMPLRSHAMLQRSGPVLRRRPGVAPYTSRIQTCRSLLVSRASPTSRQEKRHRSPGAG